jgi:hypothetical protein
MLYSKNGSYPAYLPHRIILSDGITRTDRTTFTEEEIVDAGYIAVDNPPVATYPNRLDWNGTEWLVREPNESEINAKWESIRNECVARLEATDYKVIKAVELNEIVEYEYLVYRQELRDLYNNVNGIDPWNFEFPVLIQAIDSTTIDES